MNDPRGDAMNVAGNDAMNVVRDEATREFVN